MVKEHIITSIQKYIKALNERGILVRFGVVFGSQAAGDADMWSDIDVLVVSPRFDAMQNRQDVDVLWRVAAQVDNRIEPVPCGEKQWEEDTSSAVVEIARRGGERVMLAEEP